MKLTDDLVNKGFSLQDVTIDDMDRFIDIKRECYKKYVDEYNGGWIDEIQVVIHKDGFKRMLQYTCFQKILLKDLTVGFFAWDERDGKIDGISILMAEPARNKGMGSFYLDVLTSRSTQTDKPVFLKDFKSNPALSLLKRFGFQIYDESRTHYFMSFNRDPGDYFDHYRIITQ